ncbi:MAG TPA: DnaJ domain-containing protein [Thermodesulfovibrionales bacterium]|nr:DnaJ domain-containing protein [Thermodesulfovibrionales bacterium]
MAEKDYYETLGVETQADSELIKKTYRKLAFRYHPDRTGNDPVATQKMKEINEAYATLSDPVKRKEYDSLRSAYGPSAYGRFRQSYSEEDLFRGSDINQVFEEFARMFSGFRRPEDLFSQGHFYGSKYRTFEFSRPGFSARGVFYGLGSPFGTLQKGVGRGERTDSRIPLSMKLLSKLLSGFQEKIVEELEIPTKGRDIYDTVSITPADIERKIAYPASEKWGRTKDLLIKIPRGIKNGQRIRLTGQGGAGKYGGGPGDLYIEIRIQASLTERLVNFFKGLFGS